MSGQKQLRVKNNGIFYTPEPVAALLAAQAVTRRNVSILDPACGEGSLLMAAMEECKQFSGRQGPHLVGCDKFRQQNLDHHIEFVRSDFFAYKSDEKFDLILTNPPYIQSERINIKARGRYYTRYAHSLGLPSNLDLWVYFLIKCTTHLKKGGAIAAVLPWSFFEAEYAQGVRKWIAGNFKKVRTFVLQGAHFEDTVKRVVLVWLEGYGYQARRLQIGCSDECVSKPYFQNISTETWNSENILHSLNPETNDIIRRLQEIGFEPFEKYANVSIGVVTGANDYFVLPKENAARLGFRKNSTSRILTSVADLRKAAITDSCPKVLVHFKRMTKKKRDYVRKGTKLGINKRVHCLRRKKQMGSWYAVNPGTVPNAFFTYRVSTIPYLLQNPDSYQCTNALHKVFFNGISKTRQKWIQLSLLSLFGQLSLELSGRHYGNGIIKIEPSPLKRSLVYASRAHIKKKTYNNILQALFNGDKDYACLEATCLIAKEADMDDRFIDKVLTLLNKIRVLRGAPILHSKFHTLQTEV